MKKLTTEEFIRKAESIHGNKYDYSLVNHVGSAEKVNIFCKTHLEYFLQVSSTHLAGHGCYTCGKEHMKTNIPKTTEQFIEDAIKVHGDKFIYDRVKYINSKTKVEIFCKAHNGYFFQNSGRHLEGNGCRDCGKSVSIKPKTTEQFISEAVEIHNNNFDYSLSEYKNSRTKIKIVCKKHNYIFSQFPKLHIKKADGCEYCYKENMAIACSKPNEYYYDKISSLKLPSYNILNINGGSEITISCEKHGVFVTSFTSLKRCKEHNCPTCMMESNTQGVRKNTESFIVLAKEIHGNLYDYSKVNYENHNKPIDIICTACGETFSKKPSVHLSGMGCQKCAKEKNESKPEKLITKLLLEKGVVFDREYSFKDCIYKNKLRFDFYIPKLNMCIEYQGEQHYKAVEIFGGDGAFKLQLKKDSIKRDYCKKSNIQLVEIMYSDNIEERIKECFTKYKL